MLAEQTLTIIRSWIGLGETDQELSDAVEANGGSVDTTIRQYLRQRITSLAGQPQSLSVPGLSITNGVNIKTWQDVLKMFDAQGGSGVDDPGAGSLRAGHLVRCDLR